MNDSRDSPPDATPGLGQILRFRKTGSVRGADPGAGAAGTDLTTGDLFALLWQGLADILGTAAAATLLRRAAQRAMPHWPELGGLSIVREQLDYRYTIPSAWQEPAPAPSQALRELARELWALLVDLTGFVVTNRLAQIPELREHGIVPQREDRA